MATLNHEVRHVFTVYDSDGALKTGLTASDFTLTLKRQSSGTLVTATETVAIAELSAGLLPGQYWITYTPITATGLHVVSALEGAFTKSIGATHEFQDSVDTDYTAVAGPYLTTRANCKTAFNIPSTDTSLDAAIDALLAQVTAFVQTFCGRSFISATFTEYPKGHDSECLILNEYPVTSVTSVHVSTDLPRLYDATTSLTVSTEYIVETGSGIVYRVDGGTFPDDVQANKVVYVAGYAEIPADLERAAQEIIQVKLYKGAGKLYHLTSESRLDGSVSGIRFDDLTENARMVLELYRRERFI